MNEEQSKKSIYKKWWFWGIVVLVLIVIGSIGGGGEDNEIQETTQNQEEQNDTNKEIDDEKNTEVIPSRIEIAEDLNQTAKNRSANVTFNVDPNDDTTLIVHRDTDLKPVEVQNWENYLYSVGSSPEKLKNSGFTKVRIYTNVSESVADYDLKIL